MVPRDPCTTEDCPGMWVINVALTGFFGLLSATVLRLFGAGFLSELKNIEPSGVDGFDEFAFGATVVEAVAAFIPLAAAVGGGIGGERETGTRGFDGLGALTWETIGGT